MISTRYLSLPSTDSQGFSDGAIKGNDDQGLGIPSATCIEDVPLNPRFNNIPAECSRNESTAGQFGSLNVLNVFGNREPSRKQTLFSQCR